MDLNKVQLIGRVTQAIEMKTTPNGNNVVSFSIATNREWKDSSGTKQSQGEFHNIVLWGKLAEIANSYFTKGKLVYIEGRLETKSWEAQDGTKRYKTEIVGENIIMLDSKGGESKDTETSTNTKPASTKAPAKTEVKEDEISIEDIPF